MTAVCGIYLIEHVASGRVYVGSSNAIVARLCKHRSLLRKNAHHSVKLQNAWNKYGAEAFAFKTITLCAECDLMQEEQRAIDFYQSASKQGFNVLPNACVTRGHKHTDEARANMSRAQLGHVVSPEARANMSASRTGVKQSPETVQKRRLGQIGKMNWPLDDPRRLEIAEMNRTRVITPEARQKMVAAKQGKKRGPQSEEHKAKISESNKVTYLSGAVPSRMGTTRSQETKNKVSEGLRKYWAEKKASNG